MDTNLEIAKRYLAAIEQMGDCAALKEFLAPHIVQTELPNRLVPSGATRDLSAMLDGCERGKMILSAQRYEIQKAYACDDTVIMEVLWTGTMAVEAGTLPVGGEMKAHFALFMQFQDGKIVSQRNYDCFEPW
ncbi:MAG: nuclear transport factor 2 family protein [Caldilineaceae bacterium]|nr:nuclear transport factor 2 family protein [Caldilineaceae bacterium]MCB0140379.1 nuclear transport factor 2 family protein [Caldilineaceae bacterium]MCB9157291.1 nuclear transport factor 2 family protein [Caldilineaceae bacterium]